MTLGARIRAAIDASGLSIEEVARQAEIARSQLNKILNGTTRSPGIRIMARIAAAIGVTVNDLIAGVDDIEGPDEVAELGDVFGWKRLMPPEEWEAIQRHTRAALQAAATELGRPPDELDEEFVAAYLRHLDRLRETEARNAKGNGEARPATGPSPA